MASNRIECTDFGLFYIVSVYPLEGKVKYFKSLWAFGKEIFSWKKVK